MKQFNFMRAVGFAVVFAVTLLGMTTKAEAHAGNTSASVIHACRGNVLGVTRIVGVNGTCRKPESAVHWAIASPAGATGATGPAGTPAPVHAIGDVYGGGIVFDVDDEGQHGLIAATADQDGGAGIQWYNGSFTVTNAVRDGANAGHYNTERIIIDQGAGSYAAQLCANYQGGYGDWYLPSKAELNLLYEQKDVVGGFAVNGYWSSTENGSPLAWFHDFANGFQSTNDKLKSFKVRGVRAF
ncbi:DUF1566 domain-containing protein [Methyloglobulus sp.]|uniref:Lcl C-terminal domain-containing protein n=1 Tax=Methyloglobulus sp. TaxID=2518622 RepID=UPI003989F836